MSEQTGSDALWKLQLSRRDVIKIQLEKRILELVREIVSEKLEQIEPVLEEIEAIEKIMEEKK